MIMEQEDYSKIYEYESMGKEYAGEKACISLTSWKARINTVSKTLYSLLKQCPGFHIVLVLSKDEFPLMEKELPDNLMLFVENKLIELFWIRPNFKSFKKILFTMDKYCDVPVISADDDCIYTCNYAQILYDAWIKHNDCVITIGTHIGWGFQWCRGPATLYYPNCFGKLGLYNFRNVNNFINDDAYLAALIKKFGIKIFGIPNIFDKVVLFHDETAALSSWNRYGPNDMKNFFARVRYYELD